LVEDLWVEGCQYSSDASSLFDTRRASFLKKSIHEGPIANGRSHLFVCIVEDVFFFLSLLENFLQHTSCTVKKF